MKNKPNPSETLTDDMIRSLRAEAASAGDGPLVASCDRALDLEQDARAICARVITDARAQDDSRPFVPVVATPPETLTTPALIQALRDGDGRLYRAVRVASVDCLDLTDEAAALCEARGLSLDSDTYGCTYCVEAADDSLDPALFSTASDD